nr:MAG TPA: hypothetical protein [Caudoviricetes sp.]
MLPYTKSPNLLSHISQRCLYNVTYFIRLYTHYYPF